MKKSTRAILIIAVAIFIVGGVLTGIGFALGGSWYNWPNNVGGARLWRTPWFWGWSNSGHSFSYNTNSYDTNYTYPHLEDEATALEAFTQITMNTRLGKIAIEYGDDYHIAFVNCPMENIGYEVVDGRLHVTDPTRYRGGDNRYAKTSITVTVPDGVTLDRLVVNHSLGSLDVHVPVVGDLIDIDLDLGDLYLAGGNVAKCDIELDLGSAEVKNLMAQNLDMSLDLGSLTANNVVARTFIADLSLGSADLINVAANTFDVSSSMGSITMRILGDKNDYNYVIKTSMGNTTYAGESLRSGTHQNSVTGRPYSIYAKVDMGGLTISFAEAPSGMFDAIGGADTAPTNDDADAMSDDLDDEIDSVEPDLI